MTKGLSGVRADQKRSYRSLEKYACHVREHLKLGWIYRGVRDSSYLLGTIHSGGPPGTEV